LKTLWYATFVCVYYHISLHVQLTVQGGSVVCWYCGTVCRRLTTTVIRPVKWQRQS